MPKTDVEVIVESTTTKWSTAIPSQIVKIVEITFAGVLPAIHLDLNNDVKPAMFNVIEKALGEVARFGRVATVLKTQMRNLVQTKSIADIVVQAVLSHPGFAATIAEPVGRLVNGAVDECHSGHSKNEPITTAVIDLFIDCPPLPSLKLRQIPIDVKLQEANRRSHFPRCSSASTIFTSNWDP